MKYEDMSDFEINKLVAMNESLLINENQAASLKARSSSVLVNDIVNSFEFNPCNNPSDAWAIISENKISLIAVKGGYQACSPDYMYIDIDCYAEINDCCIDESTPQHGHENGLRAAMICFLKMKDAENEPSNSNTTSR